MAAHVGLQWSLNVVPDQVTFLNFQNLISLRNWFLLVVKASLVRRRACGSTRRSSVVSKCAVIRQHFQSVQACKYQGIEPLVMRKTHRYVARVAAHVGLKWSLNVVPDQVTFLNFQNLKSLRNWFLLVVKASLVRRTWGSTRRS